MDEREWLVTLQRINADVAGIVRAQRVLSEVNAELQERAARPIEEDFLQADMFGRHAGKPRVVNVDGIDIVLRMLHRRGLRQRDIKGADLLYEVEGRKFALVQYKSPDTYGRIHHDAKQLDELIEACPNPCPPHELNFWPTCGSWFAVESQGGSWYTSACQAKSVFVDAASRLGHHFHGGVTKEVFQQLFARCWVGARTAPSEMTYLTWRAMISDNVLVTALQRGSFGAW